MINAILRGKPDAGNPHVRFDEGEVASVKPRRGSLLYKKHVGLHFALIAFLIVALFPIRAYGFYVLLKFVICGGCAFLAVNASEEGRKHMVWILGGLAVLYNPIIRFPLGREIWIVVNIVTTVALIVNMKIVKEVN